MHFTAPCLGQPLPKQSQANKLGQREQGEEGPNTDGRICGQNKQVEEEGGAKREEEHQRHAQRAEILRKQLAPDVKGNCPKRNSKGAEVDKIGHHASVAEPLVPPVVEPVEKRIKHLITMWD